MKAILIHSDDKIREMLALAIEGQFSIEVDRLASPQSAVDMLLDEPLIAVIVFEDSADSIKLLKYLSSTNSNLPLVVIREGSSDEKSPFPDLKFLGVAHSPNLVENLTSVMRKGFESGLFTDGENDDFVQIKTELLRSIPSLECDIYIRLSKLKYVRIFQKGDQFDDEDMEKYLTNKNVQYFYLQKGDAKFFIGVFSKVLDGVLERQDTKELRTPELAVTVFEAATDLSKKLGFTDEVKGFFKQNVALVMADVRKIEGLGDLLKKLDKDKQRYQASHSVLVAHVACMIASKMEWSSDSTSEKLTFASLLHDITLDNNELSAVASLEELKLKANNFSEKERNAFLHHTLESANIANSFEEIPPDVGTIIMEHHERPDGSGFPKQLSSKRISPLGAVFIIAHDIVSAYLLKNIAPADYIKSNIEQYQKGNFRGVIEAIKKESSFAL